MSVLLMNGFGGDVLFVMFVMSLCSGELCSMLVSSRWLFCVSSVVVIWNVLCGLLCRCVAVKLIM